MLTDDKFLIHRNVVQVSSMYTRWAVIRDVIMFGVTGTLLYLLWGLSNTVNDYGKLGENFGFNMSSLLDCVNKICSEL